MQRQNRSKNRRCTQRQHFHKLYFSKFPIQQHEFLENLPLQQLFQQPLHILPMRHNNL